MIECPNFRVFSAHQESINVNCKLNAQIVYVKKSCQIS